MKQRVPGSRERAWLHAMMNHLLRNISHDQKKQLISYNISLDAEHFPTKLLPFYEMPVVGSLDFMLNLSVINIAKIPMKLGDVVYHHKYEIFKLSASHPTYCETHYIVIENGKFIELTHSFHQSKGGCIVAKTYAKVIHLDSKSKQKIMSRRQDNKQKWKKMTGN